MFGTAGGPGLILGRFFVLGSKNIMITTVIRPSTRRRAPHEAGAGWSLVGKGKGEWRLRPTATACWCPVTNGVAAPGARGNRGEGERAPAKQQMPTTGSQQRTVERTLAECSLGRQEERQRWRNREPADGDGARPAEI